MNELELRVARLERVIKALSAMVVLMVVALGVGVVAVRPAEAGPQVAAYQVLDSLRLRQLIVVDSNGRERARVGAPLPDPIMLGKRFSRGGGVSGFMIFDAEGNERGGYVTGDRYPNALLTLDDIGSQKFLFLAEPNGSANIGIFHNNNAVWLGAGEGESFLRLEKGRTVVRKFSNDSTAERRP